MYKDKQGRYLTLSLFRETVTSDKFTPVFTLREESIDNLPSLYQIYMESVDEYAAAQESLGSWKHWQKLCATKWFTEGMKEIGFDGLNFWREEKELRDKSFAKEKLVVLAEEGNLQAAKLLYEGKTKETRGRPKKSDIAKEAKKLASDSSGIEKLYDRFKIVNEDD